MADERPVLELRDITKRFPGVLADDHVDFDLRDGEVHALLGENGAGKSTLMNIVCGLYHADEGEIRVNGEPIRIHSPKDAISRGIGMVHQHFMLIPVMTVAENVVLANEPTQAGVLLDYGAARKRVAELSRTFNFRIDPEARVERISVGAQELFEILRTLVREGMSVIFISHKLNEVLEIADRITVLRRGKKIETVSREGASEEGLARMMVGRQVLLRVDKAPAQPSAPVLRVEDL